MSSDTTNPDGLRGQEEIFGRGASFSEPLKTDLPKKRKEQLEEAYKEWLFNSPFAYKLVFLDITFAPVGARLVTAEVDTLIVSHSASVAEVYKTLLQEFIGDGQSIAALPYFQNGLSIDGNGGTPQDRFLLWAENENEQSDPTVGDQNRLKELHSEIISTYRTPQELDKSRPKSGDELIPVAQRWSTYVDLLRRSPALRSHPMDTSESEKLGVIGAAPLGVRHPRSPDRFNPIAYIFFGLNRRSGSTTALSFLQRLFLQLLRNNAAIRSSVLTERKIIAAIGHEVRRVTDMMGALWVPPAKLLFDVSSTQDAAVPAIPEAKVGRIQLNSGFEFLMDELYVAPFGFLLGAARRTIDLWAFSSSEASFPVEVPQNWTQLVECAWRSAVDQVIMYFLRDSGAYSASEIPKRRAEVESLRASYAKQCPCVIDKLSDQSAWKRDDDTVIEQLASILRVLLAWFTNCVEHGTLCEPIRVTIDSAADGQTRLQMTIENRKRKADEQFPEFTRARSRSPEAKLHRDEPHTRESIQLALAPLNGDLELFEDAEAEIWTLKCEFDWRMSNVQ